MLQRIIAEGIDPAFYPGIDGLIVLPRSSHNGDHHQDKDGIEDDNNGDDDDCERIIAKGTDPAFYPKSDRLIVLPRPS